MQWWHERYHCFGIHSAGIQLTSGSTGGMDILVIETAICHSYVASLVSKVSTLTAAVLQHEKYEVSHGRPMSGVKGIKLSPGWHAAGAKV